MNLCSMKLPLLTKRFWEKFVKPSERYCYPELELKMFFTCIVLLFVPVTGKVVQFVSDLTTCGTKFDDLWDKPVAVAKWLNYHWLFRLVSDRLIVSSLPSNSKCGYKRLRLERKAPFWQYWVEFVLRGSFWYAETGIKTPVPGFSGQFLISAENREKLRMSPGMLVFEPFCNCNGFVPQVVIFSIRSFRWTLKEVLYDTRTSVTVHAIVFDVFVQSRQKAI